MKTAKLLAGMLLASSAAVAQTPNWTVALTPTLSPLAHRTMRCGASHAQDPVTKDVPRNPQGYRITMADFDLTVSGTVVAGHQIDSTHFETCGCQSGAIGTSATITARYPAQSLPAAARVPGVSFQQTATVTLAEVKGPVNPPSCISLASNTPDAPGNPISAGVASGGAIAAARRARRRPVRRRQWRRLLRRLRRLRRRLRRLRHQWRPRLRPLRRLRHQWRRLLRRLRRLRHQWRLLRRLRRLHHQWRCLLRRLRHRLPLHLRPRRCQ